MTETIRQKPYDWYLSQTGYAVVGYLWSGKNNQLLTAQTFLDYVIQHLEAGLDVKTIKKIIEKWHGCYAVITPTVAFVDPLRSIPLFFNPKYPSQVLTDVTEFQNLTIHPSQATVFKEVGYTIGSETLFNNVLQIPACFILDKKTGKLSRYTNHFRTQPVEKTPSELVQNLHDSAQQFAERTITRANGKTIAVLLSGGYDSRLVLAALVQAGAKNLVSITYGIRSNPEAITAKTVSERLGINWHFVEYTPQLLNRFFSERYQRYFDFAFRGVSLPYEQDVFALDELKQKGVIHPDNTMIVNGFCGDILAGRKMIPALFQQKILSRKQTFDSYVYNYFFGLSNKTSKSAILSIIQNKIKEYPAILTANDLINCFEAWFIETSIAHYTLNGVRAYEWLGLDWHLPLWDAQWYRLWYAIANEQRQRRALFCEFANKSYFKPMGLPLAIPDSDVNPLKLKLKSMLNAKVWHNIKRLLNKPTEPNPNNLLYLKQTIRSKLSVAGIDFNPIAGTNGIEATWFYETVVKTKAI